MYLLHKIENNVFTVSIQFTKSLAKQRIKAIVMSWGRLITASLFNYQTKCLCDIFAEAILRTKTQLTSNPNSNLLPGGKSAYGKT